ncbi:MAG TPA: hypothetical protein VMX97_02500 [Hyphomicrobiaceae bacterium]|nr:hypothetical protein [Hyphomicrobiaceae bacterium]
MIFPKILTGESGARLLQGALFGAVAATIIGFSWGGWMLGSAAESLAAKRVTTSLVAAYAPVCVERYGANATAKQREEFKNSSQWSRDSVIEKTGFATPPGSKTPNGEIADACAQALTKILNAKA